MDTRIRYIFDEEMLGDNSFRERAFLFPIKFTQTEAREIWHSGIKHGIEIGLRRASLPGQIIDLNKNTTHPRHKEFLEKFYALCAEYQCAITFHQEIGMVVTSRNVEEWDFFDSPHWKKKEEQK